MDIQQVCQLLHHCTSYDATQRKAAEMALEQVQGAPGHLAMLLTIAMEESLGPEARQVAAIRFKNLTKRMWDDPEKPNQVSEEDKHFIRTNLVESVIRAPPMVRSQLQETARTIIYADFPENWPNLMDQVYTNLNTQDQQRIIGALLILRLVARKFEFKEDSGRGPLQSIVEGTFPLLLTILQTLIASENPALEVAEAMKLILKIYWSCSYMGVPPILVNNEQQFQGWMTALHTLITAPLPTVGQPEDPTERSRWVWWKVKKWALHISNRIFSRYGDPKHTKHSTDKAFAKRWKEQCSAPFLEAHMTLMHQMGQGTWLSPRVTNQAVQYLTHAIPISAMYKLMKPHMQGLLVHVIFPLCCFNDQDQELWDDDPQEYIRKGYDIIEDLYNPRTSAMNFIHELCRVRSSGNLDPFMAHLIRVLNEHAAAGVTTAPQDVARRMDGALLAVGALQLVLTKKEPYKSQLEMLLSQYVLPLFDSPWGHLRAKAAWLAGTFSDIEFAAGAGKGPVFQGLLQQVVNRLLHDPDLPVKVDACVALRSFVEPFEAEELAVLKPLLPALLEAFFKLMSEVDSEDCITTLEALIETFSEDMAEYAVALTQHLAQAFWKAQTQDEQADEDDDQAALAAYGCVRAMCTLLETVNTLPHLYPQLEEILFPIMDRYLTPDGESIFEEVVQILSYFTFLSPELSPRLWSLWPKLHAAVVDWGIDYFDEILVCLDNYISRGTDTFLSSTNPNYLASANQMAETILTSDALSAEDDITLAAQLLSIILQNCRGKVDMFVGAYLKLALTRLQTAESAFFKDQLICVVANALHYNPQMTMQQLQQLGALQGTLGGQFKAVQGGVFGAWYSLVMASLKSGKPKHFRRMYDKKVAILGLSSLLTLPDSCIPPELAASWPQVMQMLFRLLTTLRDKQAEDAAAENEEATEEEEEEDDDDLNVVPDLADDESEASDGEEEYIRRVTKSRAQADEEESDSSDEWTEDEEQSTTPIDSIDPFQYCSHNLQACQQQHPARFAAITGSLNAAQQALLQQVFAGPPT